MEDNNQSKHLNTQSVHGSSYASEFDDLMHTFIIEKFRRLFTGANIIELGGYKGGMTSKLLGIASAVTTVDFDGVCVDSLNRRFIDWPQFKAIHTSFQEFNDYDRASIVLMQHSLEHIESPESLLRHIHKRLPANAIFICIVPNARSLSRRIASRMGVIRSIYGFTDFEIEIGHKQNFDLQTLNEITGEAGFRIIESGGIMPKFFSNGQYSKLIGTDIFGHAYFDALNSLSSECTDFCASVFVTAARGEF
jgi:hypothetical protein